MYNQVLTWYQLLQSAVCSELQALDRKQIISLTDPIAQKSVNKKAFQQQNAEGREEITFSWYVISSSYAHAFCFAILYLFSIFPVWPCICMHQTAKFYQVISALLVSAP